MDNITEENPKILIVDDISMNVEIMQSIIEAEGYDTLCALSVQEAVEIMKEDMPSLILSDLSMPGIDGLEFCRMLNGSPRTKDIPFIFISVLDTSEEKERAFRAGAVDFITKPFERIEVIMRVNNHLNSYRLKRRMADYNRMMHELVEGQKKQIEKERYNVLNALVKVAARRNSGTEDHLENVGYNSRLLAQSLQLLPEYEDSISDEFVDSIELASKLHDIGNIIIPDSVVSGDDKPGEAEIKEHINEGIRLLEEIFDGQKKYSFLDMAINIAGYHHANWDGTGWPHVKGTEIPLEARITTLAVNFDVLLSKQCCNDTYNIEEIIRTINEGDGIIFDPDIVMVFNKIWRQMRPGSVNGSKMAAAGQMPDR